MIIKYQQCHSDKWMALHTQKISVQTISIHESSVIILINCKQSPLKSTSPITRHFPDSESWTSVNPTSMTTASCFTMSAVMSPGVPVATTRISAFCVNSRSWSCGVYRWQMVVVASPKIKKKHNQPSLLHNAAATCLCFGPIQWPQCCCLSPQKKEGHRAFTKLYNPNLKRRSTWDNAIILINFA